MKLRGSSTLQYFDIQKVLIISGESAKYAVGAPLISAGGTISCSICRMKWLSGGREKNINGIKNTWYLRHSLLYKHQIKSSIHSENAYSFAIIFSNNRDWLQP